MKKKIAITILLTALLTVNVFGQTDVSLLDLNSYAEYFGFQSGKINHGSNYVVTAPRAERRIFTPLAGNDVQIDTPLEFALLSYYSQPVVVIRPVQADTILPAKDPEQADLKLGAAVFQEIQVLRFVGDTAAVGRHEGILKFITDRGHVTRAKVKDFYSNGIRGLVSDIVTEEFNKINFLIDRTKTTGSSYGAVLTRNPQNGQYTLNYEGYFNGTLQTKTVSAASLERLLSTMARNTDFIQDDINQVRAQAALMPAVVYADWKSKGIAGGADALALVTEALTNFYIDPDEYNYGAALSIYIRCFRTATNFSDEFALKAMQSFRQSVNALNPALLKKMYRELNTLFASLPYDERHEIFSIRRDSVR